MGIKQNLKKLLRNPSSMRIEEIVNIMRFLGYTLDRIKGSHYIFVKPYQQVKIIPTKQGKVKQCYLKTIIQIYESVNH